MSFPESPSTELAALAPPAVSTVPAMVSSSVRAESPLPDAQAAQPSWKQLLLGTGTRKLYLTLVDQAAVSGASFATSVIVGRACGKESLGLYSLGFTITVLLICAQNSLISACYTIYHHRMRRRRRHEFAGSVLMHQGLLSAVAIVGLSTAALCLWLGWGPPQLAPVLAVLACSISFVLLREFARRFEFAHLHIPAAMRLDAAVAGLQLAGLLALWAGGWLGPASAHATTGLACALVSMTWLLLARSRIVVSWPQARIDLGRNWKFARWVLAGQLTGALGANLLPWILAALAGTQATGTFATCLMIVLFANPLLLGATNVLGPWTARAFAEGGYPAVRRVVCKSMVLLGGTMLLFCAMAALFGGRVVQMVYGPDYAGQQAPITVLAFTVLLSSLGMALYNGLWSTDRAAADFRACLMGLTVTLSVAVCLIPWIGVLGAALGMLCGEATTLAGRAWVFFRAPGMRPLLHGGPA